MNLLITGMHRSGTSMLTALLNMAGADVGDRSTLTGPGQWNKKGFWEQNGIRAINEELLIAAEAEWDRPLRFSLDKLGEERLQKLRDAAKSELSRFDGTVDWVLKDPRFCLTLPFWSALLSQPIAIIPVRSPLEVAQSLFSRNGIPLPIGVALWEWYLLKAVESSSSIPRVLVSHAALTQCPVEALGKLVGELHSLGCLGLKQPEPKDVSAFVDPSLHNARASDEQLGQNLARPQLKVWRLARSGHLSALAECTVSAASLAALEGYEVLESGFTRRKAIEMRLDQADQDTQRASA
jgi:hypothetical protein